MHWNDIWPPKWGALRDQLVDGSPWIVAAAAVAATVLVALLLTSIVRSIGRKDGDAKASIGFAFVQCGVSYIVITGVYQWFRDVLDMPPLEAAVLAMFIEASTWAAVGFIYAHGRRTVEAADGTTERTVGFGEAGPFFWFAVAGGGLLAILGSDTGAVAFGRTIIVGLGAYMWYLRLLQATQRPGAPSRWRLTPKRALLAIGAIEPADEDVTDVAREWQVRRLARAMRWSNGGRVFAWFGNRALVKGAEQAGVDVLAEARRRYAAGYVLRTQVQPTSSSMAAVIAAVEASMVPPAAPSVDPDQAPVSAPPAITASPEPVPAPDAPTLAVPGSDRWLRAVWRLSAALTGTLQPYELVGQQGRGVLALAEELGARVPELDSATVAAYVADHVAAAAGSRTLGEPDRWGGALDFVAPILPARAAGGHRTEQLPGPVQQEQAGSLTGQPRQDGGQAGGDTDRSDSSKLTDDELYARFGQQLAEIARKRSNGTVGRATVSTVCGVGSGRAARIMDRVNDAVVAEQKHQADLDGRRELRVVSNG